MHYYDGKLFNAKLHRWETYLKGYDLPKWEELPQIGLYMDQVVELLLNYLNFLPADNERKLIISANAINNYVRLKVMPAPIKRKYYREHVAYLIMICTLKQVLSLSDIKNFISSDLDFCGIEHIYRSYTRIHKRTADAFVEQVRMSAKDILDPAQELVPGESDTSDVRSSKMEMMSDICFDFTLNIAIGAAFSRLLVDKLVNLEKIPMLENGHTQSEEGDSARSDE